MISITSWHFRCKIQSEITRILYYRSSCNRGSNQRCSKKSLKTCSSNCTGFTPAPVKPRPSPAPPNRTSRPLLRDYDATNSSPSPSAAASSSSSTCAAIQQSIQRQAREAETSRPWLQQLLPALEPTAQICAAKTARLSKIKQSHQHRWWSSWDTEKQPPRHRWSLQAAASADLRVETV